MARDTYAIRLIPPAGFKMPGTRKLARPIDADAVRPTNRAATVLDARALLRACEVGSTCEVVRRLGGNPKSGAVVWKGRLDAPGKITVIIGGDK